MARFDRDYRAKQHSTLDTASPRKTSLLPESINRSGRLYGFLLCFTGELFYCSANFLLRCMTEYREVDICWTLAVKEAVTVLAVLPIILFLIWKGRYHFPSWRTILLILLAAFSCEYIGARSYLGSFAILGVVLAIPIFMTFQLVGSNLLGVLTLDERMTKLKLLTMFVLIVSVIFLGLSHYDANMAKVGHFGLYTEGGLGQNLPMDRLLYGLFVVFISGVSSTIYICIMRYVMRPTVNKETGSVEKKPVPLTLSMFLICGFGALVFAQSYLHREGFSGLAQIPRECWLLTLGAGVTNCIGFCFRNLTFRAVSASKLVFVSVIQVVFMTLIGIFYFHEMGNTLVWIGLSLTLLGISMAGFTR